MAKEAPVAKEAPGASTRGGLVLRDSAKRPEPQDHPGAATAPEAGKWEQLASPLTGRSETPEYPAHLCHGLGDRHIPLSFFEPYLSLQENQALRAAC